MNNLQFTIYKKIGISLFIAYCLLFINSAHAQSVDLLYQGETYVSPFYQGRSLWSKQSQVTLMAIPQGLGNPNTLNYKWSRNGTVLGSASGVGKNNLRFSDSIFSKPVKVRVQIISPEGETLTENSVTLTPVSPALYVYENNPLNGFIFHREIGEEYTLENKEVTFTAFPFFSSSLSRTESNLNYKWSANNNTTETTNSVTYRAPEEGQGRALVNLNFTNNEAIMEVLSRSFIIKFGE